jgi:hypothetical protein
MMLDSEMKGKYSSDSDMRLKVSRQGFYRRPYCNLSEMHPAKLMPNYRDSQICNGTGYLRKPFQHVDTLCKQAAQACAWLAHCCYLGGKMSSLCR